MVKATDFKISIQDESTGEFKQVMTSGTIDKQDFSAFDECTINDGIELCRILHKELYPLGLFPALTGGLIYKDGQRKDIDVVIYRHRQDRDGFEIGDQDIVCALHKCGVLVTKCHGFVTKAQWKTFSVDLFNPETKVSFGENYGE